MVAATVTKYFNTQTPTMEMVMLSASDSNTYKSRKFTKITAAIACFNVNTDDSISVTNGSDNSAIDGTESSILINSSSASTSAIFLVLWGEEGALA